MQPELTAERVAHNQSIFREANEAIEQRAHELRVDAPAIPFICECPEPRCTSVGLLSRVEYELVRSHGNWFLAVPGHEVCVYEGEDVARVAKSFDNFSLMETLGRAGDVAVELDPRR